MKIGGTWEHATNSVEAKVTAAKCETNFFDHDKIYTSGI